MLPVRARRSFTVLFDQCSVLVFHTAVVVALIHSCRGQSEVIGSLQPVVALTGDDIILPCHLDPVMDTFGMTVEWARPDLDPRFVLVWRDSVELESKKHPSYDRRTSLFTHELKSGNISLKISKVKLSDEGMYRCFVPELKRDTTVQLVVGAASSPVAEIKRTGRVVLQCESAGWYPQPELRWLDSEGKLLSAGPTETVRGPDGLYTVSSRVTVEKKHSNNFTCRVQQKSINQSRETHIHVPDDFFMVISPSSPPSNPTSDPNIIIGLAVGAVFLLILILAVFFVVWKRRRANCRNKKKSEEDGSKQTVNSKNDNCGFHVVVEEGESEPLMTGREEEDDVDSRGEKNFKEERGTQHDETQTEQRRDTSRPEMNTSTLTEKESQFKMKQETHEEEDMTGRQETNNVDSRGEQRNKDGRKTQDHHVTEAELKQGLVGSEEVRIKQFIMTEKVSQSTAEQGTDEIHEMTGRGMKAEGGEGEREKKTEGGKANLGLQFFQLPQEHKEQPVLVKAANPFNFTFNLNTDQEPWREKEKHLGAADVDQNNFQRRKHTEKMKLHEVCKQPVKKEKNQKAGRARKHQNFREVKKCVEKQNDEHMEANDAAHSQYAAITQQHETIKWPKDKQMLPERKEPQECVTENNEDVMEDKEHKEQPVLVKEAKSFNFTFHLNTDQEPWREKEKQKEQLVEKRQTESDLDRKKLDIEKKRAEENRSDVNNLHSVFMAQKKTQEHQREKLETEKQREENQRDNMGTTERKTEEQRGQKESMNSSVSSKVTPNTDLTVQDKGRGQNQEKQPEEKSQQSREKIREQPKKQRRAQRKGGPQGEMMEINEGVKSDGTNRKDKERGVDCLEEPQEEELMELDKAPDVDQKNIKKRKNTEEIKLYEVCKQPTKKQKIQEAGRARKHQNLREVKKCVEKQNDDHMEVDDAAHSQYAAITQQHETIKWPKDQQMLPEQKEPQECVTENNEALMDVN